MSIQYFTYEMSIQYFTYEIEYNIDNIKPDTNNIQAKDISLLSFSVQYTCLLYTRKDMEVTMPFSTPFLI